MKILVITPFFPSHPNDKYNKYIYDSIYAQHNLGHEIKVLVTHPWKPKFLYPKQSRRNIQIDKFPKWLEIKVCHFLSIPRFYLFSFSILSYKFFVSSIIKRILNTWKCDLIHVHSDVHTLTAVKLGKLFGIPVVTTIHGIETNKRYWKATTIQKGLINANRVVLVGYSIKPFYTKLVGHDEHFRIINNGFDAPADMYKKEPIYWGKRLKIISVGSLADDGKGVDINLHALAKLKVQGITEWDYTIVGEGCLRPALENIAKKLKIESQVKFVGACDHDQVYHYLLQSNIFCLPSYREAFGIAHLEAMASGLLVIGVQGQGPETFITHNKTGLLVVPKNINALFNCLKYVFTNREKMHEIQMEGKRFAWENFTWEHHAKKLDAIYQELVLTKNENFN